MRCCIGLLFTALSVNSHGVESSTLAALPEPSDSAALSSQAHTNLQSPALVGMERDIARDYRRFLAGRDPLSVTDYTGEFSRRDVVEVALFFQALAFGGYHLELDLDPGDSYRRIVQQVGVAKTVASGPLVWREDVHDSRYFISEAIVRPGEFVVGLYTSPDNQKALKARSLDDLKSLSAVSSHHWRADWRVLKTLPMKSVYDTFLWSTMVRMVWAGRADFTLAPFQTGPDMAIEIDDLKLVPIPGIKLALEGSRHWVVSRQHPEGSKVFSALEVGIAQLRQRGLIAKAYRDSGFYNNQVRDWALLNSNFGQTLSQEPSDLTKPLTH